MTEFLFIRIIDLILTLTFQVILWMNPQMSTLRIFHNYKSINQLQNSPVERTPLTILKNYERMVFWTFITVKMLGRNLARIDFLSLWDIVSLLERLNNHSNSEEY